MNQDNAGMCGEAMSILIPGPCPTASQAFCSLRKAFAILAGGRNGPKDSLTRCEVEAFLVLAPGHRVVVLDHETGGVWHGSVDVLCSQQGFVWVFTDLGERKMFDIALHTVWRPESLQACTSQRQGPGAT